MLLLAVLGVFTGQQALAPVQAPLARDVGLSELSLGLVLTCGAAMYTATALLWGRAVDRFGQRTVLLGGLGLSLAGLLGFAVVGHLALDGRLDPEATLVLMIATRSLLFGAGVGAVPVAAMAFVPATTPAEADRTRGIGQVGAVQGVAVALGPALGGALGFAGVLGPLWAAPVVVAVALLAVLLLLPATEQVRPARPDVQARPGSLRPWDARLWPVLVAGFGLYLALGMTLVVLGFLLQDRFDLDSAATVRATGAASFAAGVVLVLTQGALVPRLRWPASRLLRLGAPVTALGLLLLLAAGSVTGVVASLVVLALGMGLALPGYTTAPTLLVGAQEQGSIAGLVQTVTGLTFVLAPVGGTALYGVSATLPVAAAAAACVLATGFVWLHPALRPPATPTRRTLL